jgi:YidC/Oxa1 family membrane protein insertase
MDKNTITGLVLIFAIFIGFSVFNSSRNKKAFSDTVKKAETEMANGNFEGARTDYVNALRFKLNQPEVLQKISELNVKLGITPEGIVATDTVKTVVKTNSPVAQDAAAQKDPGRYGSFAASAEGENEFITLENNKISLRISTKGGRLYSAMVKDFKTYDSLPIVLFSGDSTKFGFNFFTIDNKAITTNDLFFKEVEGGKSIVVSDKPESVVLRLYAGTEKYVEYKYTLAPDKYSVAYDVTFRNLEGIVPSNMNNISFDWKMYVPQQEKGRQNEETYSNLKYKFYQEKDVELIKKRQQKEVETLEIPTKLSWIAYQDQFFSSVLMTDDFFLNASLSSTRTLTSSKYIRYFTSEIGLPFNQGPESKVALKFYFGPNHISTLRKEGQNLEKIVFLGYSIIGWISRFVIIPIFNWLNNYIGNYGIIILLLTIIIKVVLFPLTFKSYQSTAKMAVLKPMVDEINKKYPKQDEALKKQQATMELYKRAGVSPMGGCLPMLLQFPILFAMFRFFPVSIELRQQHFLWVNDLSAFDSILNLPFAIPIYGNHVSLWALLMTASSLLTMKMTGSQPGQDQPGMKLMMYMMPVMFLLIMNNLSSGLTYYYFLANMLTWLQNIISKRFIDTEKVLATLEANKKKPVPKSKWQQRLEEASKQRGLNSPKR